MRTTLNIDDDAMTAARAYARAREIKLGQAVSELIRRGSSEKVAMKQVDEVCVFDLPADTPIVVGCHCVKHQLALGGAVGTILQNNYASPAYAHFTHNAVPGGTQGIHASSPVTGLRQCWRRYSGASWLAQMTGEPISIE